MSKEKEIEELRGIIVLLMKKVDALVLENKELKHRLSKYEHPKNSNNSSIPPSKDENRPSRKSLREPSGRKRGGQKGRKGNTLKMVSTPDIIEQHIPEYCHKCGKDISELPYELAGKRQVIDLPEIKVQVREHQIYKRKCSCGHETISKYPPSIKAPVSYGGNIESLIGYFHTRQYLPFKRMQELLNDVFHVPISEGGIHYLLRKLAVKARPAYDLIREKLMKDHGYAVGADETGVKVNGKKHWAWTWQHPKATFINITDNRAGRSITDNFKNGFKHSVLVHDCWASHFNTPATTHQICIAHLLRDLNYLSERYDHKWSRICKKLLKSALDLKSTMHESDYYVHNPQRAYIEKRLDRLLDYPLDKKHKELVAFQKRLIKYRDFILTFLYHPKVPPDNNASERAIRNIKVKQKVSGQFMSSAGADVFAILRSVTDTIIKNKQQVVPSLRIIANLGTD